MKIVYIARVQYIRSKETTNNLNTYLIIVTAEKDKTIAIDTYRRYNIMNNVYLIDYILSKNPVIIQPKNKGTLELTTMSTILEWSFG